MNNEKHCVYYEFGVGGLEIFVVWGDRLYERGWRGVTCGWLPTQTRKTPQDSASHSTSGTKKRVRHPMQKNVC